MKANLLTTIALLTTFALPALAYTPSQGVTFEEFVTARGCVLIEVDGSNAKTFKGGCPAAAEFMATSGGNLVDTDNDPSTAPEWVSNR